MSCPGICMISRNNNGLNLVHRPEFDTDDLVGASNQTLLSNTTIFKPQFCDYITAYATTL